MGSESIRRDILKQLDELGSEQQQRVLAFARRLAGAKPSGVRGKDLLRFAGSIGADDLALMSRAIDEGCERIDLNEW